MSAKKTTAGDKNDFPQTWDELAGQAEFTGIPKLTLPQHLTVTDSAMFEVTRTRVNRDMRDLNDMGVFTGDTGDDYDDDRATMLIAETVGRCNQFLESIAEDKTAWDEWTRGRGLYSLFSLFTTLFMFYGEQLGKSDASKTPTGNTGSN